MRGCRVAACAALLCGCAPAPPPPKPQPPPDPTAETSYQKDALLLVEMARQGATLAAQGRSRDAGAVITQAQPVQAKLLAAPRPPLAVMEAASDLDRLYGTLLLANRHYAWARQFFRKNQVRWKNWQPQTDETARRRAQAEAAIAECDRRMQAAPDR
jgi:hypothetical protein